MKSSILKFVFLLFTFILTVGCSVDREDSAEEQFITANRIGDQTNDTEIICVNNNLDTEGYGITTIFVEFEPGLSREEKQAIRAPYCGEMISIELCDMNPNVELWTVRGPCHNNGPLPLVCQPGVIPPTDPDLRQAIVANNGCRSSDIGEIPFYPITGN